MGVDLAVLRGGWPVTRLAAPVVVVTALLGSPLTMSARRALAASSSAQASFATVWIQPSGTTGSGAPSNPTFEASRMTLRNLLYVAYRVSSARTVGGPGWIDEDRWQVAAKAARSSIPYHEVRTC
jgi:hypothetical protein